MSGVVQPETLTGGPADDVLTAARSGAVISGGGGNDRLVLPSVGALRDATLDGGEGRDTLAFSWMGESRANLSAFGGLSLSGLEVLILPSGQGSFGVSAVRVTLDPRLSLFSGFQEIHNLGTLVHAAPGVTDLRGKALLGLQPFRSFEGSAGEDVLDASGATRALTFSGGAGADTLSGGSGNDIFLLTPRRDGEAAENGVEIVNGGAGQDALEIVTATGPFRTEVDLSHLPRLQVTGVERLTNTANIEIALTVNPASGLFEGVSRIAKLVSVTHAAPGTTDLRGKLIEELWSQAHIVMTGSAGDDAIFAPDRNPDFSVTLTGGAGNDRLVAGAETYNALLGGEGDDWLFAPTGTLDGGPGSDTLDLSGWGSRASFRLLDPLDGRGLRPGLVSVENVAGTRFSDFIEGDHGANTLWGGAGDDSLWGLTGHDTLIGGEGHDYLYGGAGDDVLAGGSGMSWIEGGAGFDTVLFDGPLAAYSIRHAGRRDFVVDKGGESDWLFDVERIVFADAAWDVPITPLRAGQIFGGPFADVVWRDFSTSSTIAWQRGPFGMTGFTTLKGVPYSTSYLRSDLDGDGLAELLSGSFGGVGIAMLDPRGHDAAYAGVALPTRFALGAVADTDADGRSELVLRDATGGGVQVWGMQGATKIWEGPEFQAGADWRLAATGDVDGDGRDDLFWTHRVSGDVHAWRMRDGRLDSQQAVGTAGPGWSLVGLGDIDGDGRADAVWRHAERGDLWAWLLDGTGIRAQGGLGRLGPDWVTFGLADHTADGEADILWQGPQGDVWVWGLDGLGVAGHLRLGTVPVGAIM